MRTAIGLALAAMVIVTTTDASAQGKKKPKKPKPDTTEEPAGDSGQKPKDARDKDEPRPSADPADKPPPPIDTDLKEKDSTRPGGDTNPWVTSGLAKRKDGSGATSFESSDPKAAADRRKAQRDAERPISLAAGGGYASENARIGMMARVGYTTNDVYGGLAFTYHLGVTQGPATARLYHAALEVGYDYRVSVVTIRGYLAGGVLFSTVSVGDKSVTSDPLFAFYPGLQLDFQVPKTPLFIGADARVLFVAKTIDKGPPSIGVFGLAGARF